MLITVEVRIYLTLFKTTQNQRFRLYDIGPNTFWLIFYGQTLLIYVKLRVFKLDLSKFLSIIFLLKIILISNWVNHFFLFSLFSHVFVIWFTTRPRCSVYFSPRFGFECQYLNVNKELVLTYLWKSLRKTKRLHSLLITQKSHTRFC